MTDQLEVNEAYEEYVERLGSYLEHNGFSDDEIDEYFEHSGVKGMKWGVRKERRQRNRALNKASRKKDAKKFEKTVDKARENVYSGKSKAAVKTAKSQYKENKAKLGSREARKILNKAREKHYNEVETSKQAKNGKEVMIGLGVLGAVYAVSAVAGAAAKSR